MNPSPLNSLPLQKAITGFVNYKTAEGLSDRSVDSYKRILEHWAEFTGNKSIAQITDHDINSYLVYMRTEYVPTGGVGTRAIYPRKHCAISGSRCVPFSVGQIPSFILKIR